jgi:hypothetical protein
VAASTIAALLALFKRLYVGNDLSNMALRRTPLFRQIVKKQDLVGEGIYVPVNYGLPVGASPSFSAAQANASASTVGRFFLERHPHYGFVTIDMEAAYASQGREGAFLSVKQKEADEAIDYIGMQIGSQFWNDGSGALGQTATDPGTGSTATITLTNRFDVVNFQLNMVLQACDTRSGGTVRTDKYKVTSIVRGTSTGTATLGLSRTSGSSNDWAVSDFLYADGSYDSYLKGVSAYVPSAVPGTGGVAASLNGQDRTADPEALAGWRGTWEGSIEESAKLLCAIMGPYVNRAASALWLSEYNWFRLEQELSAQNRKVMDVKAEAAFGTPALVLLTPKGSVPVMADPFCPNSDGFLLDHSTWEIHHMEPLPHVVMDDGLSMLRATSEDSVEIRFRAWTEAVCTRPMNNGRFPIT